MERSQTTSEFVSSSRCCTNADRVTTLPKLKEALSLWSGPLSLCDSVCGYLPISVLGVPMPVQTSYPAGVGS